ncbi:hypothetical protein M3650_05360 [Paenibacillus sp. MER TA 81-3]|uniref:hypothetical protein n=1 Tax=Paenibacillus sp. MER TA 81-3 TaxID=2939573 RepID=UPI00203E0D34|nr:hypothetical protein [Paenibacillus sp. MER TA 81-3]MCM3338078.1 hypothetical protein [Paenibacillus sp. MER TA 81-3]
MQVVETPTSSQLNTQERKGKRKGTSAPHRTAWQSFRSNAYNQVQHELTIEVRLIGPLNLQLLEASVGHLTHKYPEISVNSSQQIDVYTLSLEELGIDISADNTWELLLRLEAEQCGLTKDHLQNSLLLKVTENEHRLLWNVQAAAYRPIVYRLIQELVHIYSTLEAEASPNINPSSTIEAVPIPRQEELPYLQDAIDTSDMLELFAIQMNNDSNAVFVAYQQTGCMLAPSLYATLESLALLHHLHAADLVTAAAVTVLHRYSGQERFNVAVSDGREGTSYLQACIQESETLGDMAIRLCQDLDTAAHRQKDARLLQQLAQLPSGKPCHQVRIARHKAPDASLQTADLSWELHETIDGLLGYELDIRLAAHKDTLEVHLIHQAGELEQEIAQGIAVHLQDLLHRYTLEPCTPLWRLTESVPPKQLRIAISSTFTSGLLEDSLSFWLERLGVRYQLRFAPYNQVFQQLLNPHSLLAANHEGINLILLRLEDMFQLHNNDSRNEEDHARSHVDEWCQSLKAYRRMNMTPTQILILPSSERIQADQRQLDWYEYLTSLMIQEASRIPNVTVTSHQDISRIYPTLTTTDTYADELGHVPYTSEYFAAVGTWAVRHIYSLLKLPYRMVIVECDDVIWTGPSSEREQLDIGPYRGLLQQYIVNMQQRGILLCLCGVNSEIDMIRAFGEQRTHMPLQLRHVTTWRFGSQCISAAVKEMANEQGVRLEEVLYIGANPAFCEEVRVLCLGVTVVRAPAAPEEMESFLKDTWALDVQHFACMDSQYL